MYFGLLKCKEKMTFSHINSDVPFPPSLESDEGYTWKWDEIFDTGVDISIELEELSYVGAVCFSLKRPRHRASPCLLTVRRQDTGRHRKAHLSAAV